MQQDNDREVGAIARVQHGLVTYDQVSAAAMTRDHIYYRMQQGRWERVAPQVYRIAGCPETWHQRLLAATLVYRGVASHRSALKLHGILDYRTDEVDVSFARWRRHGLPGVTAHETVCFSPTDHTVVAGVPVTTIERTLIDAGAIHSSRFVEDALDECIRRQWTTPESVAERLRAIAGQGRNGVGVMRTILDQRCALQDTSESVLQSRFIRALRDHDVVLPVAQYTITLGHHRVARVDFAYPDRRIAIEIDGLRYHASRRSLEADAARQNEIAMSGFRLYRYTLGDLRDPVRMARTIATLLARHPAAA
jgi:predicted transcriptional regulator of viral defense system